MNNAGAMYSRLIVILNDNDMSIAPPVGVMSAYPARLISSHTYRLRPRRSRRTSRIELAENFLKTAPCVREEYARGMVTGGALFEELGFFYAGPIDGHNLDHLLPVLHQRARRRATVRC